MAKKEAPKKETQEVEASAGFLDKVGRVADLDQKNRAEDGVSVLFLSIAQSTAKALDEDETDLYIPGLKPKDFYIQSKKLRLGSTLKVVPLAFISVYVEYSGHGADAKFLGIWHKEDALAYPLVAGHYFNRSLPNGNELRPVKWVMVYLPEHPELEKVVLTFKSTANRVAKAWSKAVEANGGVSCQQVYNLTVKKVENDLGKWFEVVPEFDSLTYEVVGKKVHVFQPYAETVVDISEQLNSDYQKGNLVPRRSPMAQNVAQITGSVAEDDDIAF